jgi:hypothetical protein
MRDSDLNAWLRRVPPPPKPEEYWELFPRHVRARMTVARMAREPLPRPPRSWAWAAGLAGAVALALLVWGGERQLRQVFTRDFRQDLAQLPGNLKTFMADEHGLHGLITDTNTP